MITKAVIVNARGIEMEMLLFGEVMKPFQIRNIAGLGPVSADISTLQLASHDGVSLTGSVVGKRNIVFTIGLDPDWADQTIAGLRSMLYEYVMPKQPVTIRFESTHLPDVIIAGIVESCEPNIFVKDPEVQVSIICPNPDFVATIPTVVNGVISDGPALGPDLDDYTVIDYIGNIPTGFKMVITDSVAVPEFLEGAITINNQITAELEATAPGLEYVETFAFDSSIDAVTEVQFSSEVGSKYIQYFQAGVAYNLLHTVYPGEIWPKLINGKNRISVTAPDNVVSQSGEGLLWELTYTNRFGGI